VRRLSIRLRLTALYAALFLVTAALSITTMNVLLAQNLREQTAGIPGVPASVAAELEPAHGPYPPPPSRAFAAQLELGAISEAVLRYQWLVSGVVIALLSLVSLAVGWWLTGRLLHPLQQITATARRLSVSSLHERIALAGPHDELTELAETFDGMLARLESAVDNQRRFIANAAHELRTPLAIQRAAIQVGLEDPDRERLARVREDLLDINRRNERLISGLLLLARGEHGLETEVPLALDEVVRDALSEATGAENIAIFSFLEHSTVRGDRVLLQHLVGNLLHNAVRYNQAGGQVHVRVSAERVLSVSNTGPEIPAERVQELFEPFRRLHTPRTESAEGAGLGLSIVAAIARAHQATISASPNPGGGLVLSVSFPVSH